MIVDDLIMSGGTVVECVGALKKAGAATVSAYVTHAVFPQQSWKQFTSKFNCSEVRPTKFRRGLHYA